jgi:hypothetical protein
VREFVERHVSRYNNRLISLGLPPARVKLEVRPATSVAEREREALLAHRVSQRLAKEIARLEGVTIRVVHEATAEDANTLTVNVTNDFEAEAFFDSVDVRFALQLSHDEERHEYRDSFDSDGLVRIVAPAESSQDLFVSAETANGQLVMDSVVKPDAWFLLPVGAYRQIVVRSKAGVWRAPTRVGLQNLWDLSAPAISVTDDNMAEASPVGSARREVVRAKGGSPRLEIVSPTDGATVPRCCTVYGGAFALEGCSVVVVVTPLGDVEYPQHTCGLVKDGSWRSPRCYFGRPNADSGHQFYVKARAFAANGGLRAESPVIIVTRQ